MLREFFLIKEMILTPITSVMLVLSSNQLSYEGSLYCEQVNLLGSCVSVKGMMSEKNGYEVWLRDDPHTCWTIWAIVF